MEVASTSGAVHRQELIASILEGDIAWLRTRCWGAYRWLRMNFARVKIRIVSLRAAVSDVMGRFGWWRANCCPYVATILS